MTDLSSNVGNDDLSSSSSNIINDQSNSNLNILTNDTFYSKDDNFGVSYETMQMLFIAIATITVLICLTICLTVCICICLKRYVVIQSIDLF
jgi:hypothetical protein